jgi:NitT/TauT family transport system permease protein
MAQAARMSGLAMPRLIAALVLLGVWQALAMSGLLFRDVVPQLQLVVAGLYGVLVDASFYANLAVTAGELAAATVIGGLAGLVVGLALGGSAFMAGAYERWVNWLGPTPKIVLFPVMLMLCGVGPASKVAMGAVSCFFPMALSVAGGVRGVDPALLLVGRSFRASRTQMLRTIYLPAMSAPLVNGIRLGFGVALIGVLLAETKLSNQGIGYMIMQAYARFDMPRMYALLILSVAGAVGVNMLTGRVATALGGKP